MHLKNLTIFGFKSFADKTSLDFQPGITAIVGPNGCGKSNVADAIRWVLGEQSAKALRGGEMADVIFNGTEGRKQLAVAEVSLTIGGIDAEHLKASGVELSYDELTLTRRVFRDGGSDYFLNKTPCRLKDIQQLFAGTGVGRTSYSIMAQGNITQILSSKPEDRRMVFEEAAGITRYKVQKKEALRKLDSTEQNLLRVSDLIREVKRQIISLQRQAGKARRYRQYMTELQHLETQLARHQYDGWLTEIQERQARVEGLRRESEAASELVLGAESELGELRQRLSELEHEISGRQQRGLELKAEVERHENRIQFNERRLQELATQNADALAEIEQGENRRIEAEQELESLRAQVTEAETQRQARSAERDQRRSEVQAIEQDLQARQQALRQLNNDLFREAQQLARLRNQVSALDLQKQANLARLDKLSAEKVQLEEERRQTEQRREEFVRDSEAAARSVAERRLSLEETQQRLRELQQRHADLGRQLDTVQREQAAKHSRQAVLEQLVASHEGFGEGAQAALKSSRSVLGTLVDRIRVPDEFIGAVEAALGHHLQLVLADQPGTAQEILRELQQGRKGRASIAALALRSGHPAAGGSEGNGEFTARLEALGARPAASVVEAEESVRPLVSALLDGTRIVVDLAAATAAWEATHGRFDFVTCEGEVLSRHGVFTGGASNGSRRSAASLLSRKNEIAELVEQAARLKAQADELSRERGGAQSELTALQAGLQQARTELQAQEVALATRQGEHNALKNSARVLAQKIETVVFELQTLRGQQQEGEEKRALLGGQLQQAEEAEGRLQGEVEHLNQAIEGLRRNRDTAAESLTEASVKFAAQEEQFQALRGRQQPLERRIGELRELVAQRRQQIETVLERKAQAEGEVEESRGRIQGLQHEREQVSAAIAGLVEQRTGVETGIGEREQTLRVERARLTRLQEQRGTLDVEIAQKQVALQNLKDRIQQKYQVDLDQVQGECIRIIYADQGPARVETVTSEEMESAGVGTDWKAVAEQVQALQQRIDEMGPVNLVAIDEYEETEQRHKFLSEQHNDLVEAKRELTDLISRINEQTREMFAETFGKIRDNFRGLFEEIFGGGRADLQLVDQDNVLESGIEIVARPPGKQLQSIRLLSGGEQTMTAVALLFAIYQVRPSPFCVLDELDAPLDEANVVRFVRVLQRFLAHSQFIIITHNKRTISTADVLYGVTMQERGVSKVVSMKFHAEQHAAGNGNAGGNGNGNGNGHGDGGSARGALPARGRSEPVPAEATMN
ncbi:MAG: chromosome segregation protein SMC [Verrucomicrobiales bacterium]|nr:chromosome segregation protein SMC [Verrucomicrobiales bacterium]